MRSLPVLLFAALGCSGTSPVIPDGGEDGGKDSGQPEIDAGFDAGSPNPDQRCDLAAQNCDAGSCLMYALPDSGYGSRCFPGACDVVRQDCPAGSKCTYVTDGGVAFERGCAAEGATDEGQDCSGPPSSNTCKRGLVCALRSLGDGGNASVCARFCNTSSNCTSPQLCYVVLGLAGTQERPLICGDPAPTCNPLAQNCAKATDGCYPSSTGSACYPAGTIANGAPCTRSNDCQKASACVGGAGSGACRAICQFPSGSPACAAGTTCIRLTNQTNVGVCQ